MFARLKDADDNGAKGDDDDGDGVIVIFVYYPQHTAEYLKDVERISTLLYEQCKDRLHLQPENKVTLKVFTHIDYCPNSRTEPKMQSAKSTLKHYLHKLNRFDIFLGANLKFRGVRRHCPQPQTFILRSKDFPPHHKNFIAFF